MGKLRVVTIMLTSEDDSEEVNMTMEFDRPPEGDKAYENQALITAMLFLRHFEEHFSETSPVIS